MARLPTLCLLSAVVVTLAVIMAMTFGVRKKGDRTYCEIAINIQNQMDGSSGILWTDVNASDPLQRVIVPPKIAANGKPKAAKTKYTCGCGQILWGKPGLQVQCLRCSTIFEEKE